MTYSHWTQRDGSVIAISEMKTDHLCHSIEMLKRNAAPHLKRKGFPETDTYRIFPIVQDLQAEMDRRMRAEHEAANPEHPTTTRGRMLELD